MRKLILIFFLTNLLWSQQISVSDINKISNNQLDQIRQELKLQNNQNNQNNQNSEIDLSERENTMNTIQIDSQINETDFDNEYLG
jgi:hypothetical protein